MRAIFAAFLLTACTPIDVGDDFDLDGEVDAGEIAIAPLDDAAIDARAPVPVDAGSDSAAPSAARAPLDPDFYFCRVQPEVVTAFRCASGSGCHATDSSMRLDPRAESDHVDCAEGRPVGAVPASFYSNLTRARAEVRATAERSSFYTCPLGRDHPVVVYRATSAEASIVRQWIEGAQ